MQPESLDTPPPGWAARLISLVQRQRWLWIPLLVAVVGGLGFVARDLKIDNSLRIWFLEDDPALRSWEAFKQQFGNDEVVTIAVTDPDSVFSPAALERVRAASTRIEDHPKIRRVVSITTGRHIDGDALEIRTEALLPEGPVSAQTGDEVRRRIEENPIYQGTLVSEDEKMTLLVVELASLDDIDAERPGILADLRAVAADELASGGGQYHFGGMGVVYEGLNAASLRDTQVFATLSYLVVFTGLFLMFRRLVWVVIGGVVVTLAIVGTVGVAAAMGRDLNMVTAVLPTLIMTIGILDLVHFIDTYDEHLVEGGGQPSRTAVIRSLALVLVPCALNSITDVAGFLGLTSAPMSAIRDMGLFAAVGLAFLFVTTLVIVVPALAHFGGSKSKQVEHGTRLRRFSEWLFALVVRRRRALLGAGLFIVAVSAVGMSRIEIDTYTIGFLHGSDPVREDHEAIEDQFGYFVPYELVVRTPDKDGIKQPEMLRRIENVERAFEAHPRVARATGLPEIISRVNQVVMDGEADEYRIPDSQAAVAQELLLYESDSRNELDFLVDGDFTVTRITARSGLPTARTIGETLADLQVVGQAELGDGARLEPTGYIPLYVRIIDHIARTQLTSFGIALVVITLVLIVLLRSVKLGLLALVPNVLPVMMVMGFMGYLGIRLDVATVLIASIVVGIAVNDTTHIFYRFKHELKVSPDDAQEAMRRTMLGTGRPVMASSIILAAGFAVLAFAGVKSVSYFGLLCASATLFALVSDLIITPAVLLSLRWKPAEK